MKSAKIILPMLLAGMISLISCSKSNNYGAPTTRDTAAYKISIVSNSFDPSPLTLLAGGKVAWTNNDTTAHSVVSDDGTSFNSGTINPGGTYTFNFQTAGSFAYHCGIHPADKGLLYVVVK